MSALRLKRRLMLFSFFDEFGPLYAVYTVWFANNGLTASEISWLFMLWAIVAMLAEVPSGALADSQDKRHLLAFAICLRAAGISLWLVWPNVIGIGIGAALWAMHGALSSGTWETLVHDELSAQDQAHTYGPLMARISQANQGGLAAGTLLAAALAALGASIPLLGWLTVALHAGSIGLILKLPRRLLPQAVAIAHPAPDDADDADDDDADDDDADDDDDDDDDAEPVTFAQWWQTLRAGLRATRSAPNRLRLLILGGALEGLFVLDEYQPLLAAARGADTRTVSLLVFAVWVGLMLGAELAARRPRLSNHHVGGLLIVGAMVTFSAILSGSVWALALVGVGYGCQNAAWILLDAHFQAVVPSAVRATVTSVRAVLGNSLVAAAFVLVALVSTGEDPSTGVLFLVAGVGILGFATLAPGVRGAWQGRAATGSAPR